MLLEAGDAVAIDEHVLVTAQPADRATHRQVRRVVDVQAIDLGDRGRADADGDCASPDHGIELLALGLGQCLRVADAGDALAARLHDHRGRHHGPTRRRNADLVDAGDPVDPRIPEVAFAAEAWNDHVGVSRGDWWSDPRISRPRPAGRPKSTRPRPSRRRFRVAQLTAAARRPQVGSATSAAPGRTTRRSSQPERRYAGK